MSTCTFQELPRLLRAGIFCLDWHPKPIRIGASWLPPGWWCTRTGAWQRPLGLYPGQWCHPIEVEAVARGAGGADWEPDHTSREATLAIVAAVDTWRSGGVAVAAEHWAPWLGCSELHVRALYHGCTPWRVTPQEPEWLRVVRHGICAELATGLDGYATAAVGVRPVHYPSVLRKAVSFFTDVGVRR